MSRLLAHRHAPHSERLFAGHRGPTRAVDVVTRTGQAWISAQCWLFPFAWLIRRPAERPANAGHERTDR